MVLDVAVDATGISFGILLSGTGEVWMSDVSFEEVGKDVPVTGQLPAQSSRPVNLKFSE